MAKKVKGSQNWFKAKMRLARKHYRVSNVRKDFLHKVTTQLCRENQAISIEDLCVRGMMGNHRLAGAIADVGWGEFRRQLEYKAQIYGVDLRVAPRFYPSSKICSICGNVKDSLRLSERVYECECCGAVLDRDLNAARNIYTVSFTGISN